MLACAEGCPGGMVPGIHSFKLSVTQDFQKQQSDLATWESFS